MIEHNPWVESIERNGGCLVPIFVEALKALDRELQARNEVLVFLTPVSSIKLNKARQFQSRARNDKGG